MSTQAARTGIHAAAMLAVTGAVAWATGSPFVFPSLGPTAYVLAADERWNRDALARVVLAHAVGVVAGFAAYHALAGGVAVTADLAPATAATGRVVASGVLALGLTSAGMVAADAVHPPACATTLIVALGLLPTVRDAAVIVVAVLVLVGVHGTTKRATRPGLTESATSERQGS